MKNNNNIEIFLFYPKLKYPKKQASSAHFFNKLDDLDSELGEAIVFFNLSAALQYSRFMSMRHVVFRAYVEQVAIEGHSNGLGLKKGFLTKQHIHGCFPDWSKGKEYIENPGFNDRHITALFCGHTDSAIKANDRAI